ncbi:DsbC family protein [Luteimonas aestuarii]|uniref:Thiol:disulfide interchange protein n=1 Tax=Luteimonas aestuarii TaxID=453837 RepID=A0A4R5TK66_9GAMM|nr:thioredoxin fold domain-containing protein [Luteimonas aestuarii]TDK19438.1 DsbC family protein [Luteimonas aestuarii]
MKPLFIALFSAFSLTACAQQTDAEAAQDPANAASAAAPAVAQIETTPGTPEDRARQAILSINPNLAIELIDEAPIPGFREVVVSGQAIYVSDDGKYLLQGNLFDVQQKRDLSQAGLSKVRRGLVEQVPASERIVFAPANPKHTVTVFTDVECGYCRRLHEEIADYNKRGIAIEYLAFPRMGLDSDDARLMVSVWCSADRRKALTDAKAGRNVPPRECDNPVATHYQLGQRIGLTGTPLILAQDGTQMPGYMPPDALLTMLDDLAARAAAAE